MSSSVQKLAYHVIKYGFLSHKVCGNVEKLQAVSGQKQSNRSKDVSEYNCGYGPYGSLMRKNIIEQWWNSTITLHDRIFPLAMIADGPSQALTDFHQTNFFHNHLSTSRQRAFDNYENYANSVFDEEIGIAQESVLPANSTKTIPEFR